MLLSRYFLCAADVEFLLKSGIVNQICMLVDLKVFVNISEIPVLFIRTALCANKQAEVHVFSPGEVE